MLLTDEEPTYRRKQVAAGAAAGNAAGATARAAAEAAAGDPAGTGARAAEGVAAGTAAGVHDSKLHGRLERVKIILSSALLLSC